MSQPQQQPTQPRDVFESQFEKALTQLDEQIELAYNLKGEVEKYLLDIQKLQFGDNTLETIGHVSRQMIGGVLDKISLLDPETAKKVPRLDMSGFDRKYPEIVLKFQKVDEALSFVPDIIVDFIKVLSQADSLNKATVKLPQPLSEAPATIQKEKTGILDYFRGFVNSLKPQYKQDFERGMGIMSTIIEDFYSAYRVWQEYKAYYMENRAVVMLSDPRACYPILLLQDELLMQDMGIILQAIDKGVRLDLTKLHGFLSDLTKNIVQSKTAQMQQQAAMMPGAAGAGGFATAGFTQNYPH